MVYRTATSAYQASGGRDVLIIAPDLSLPHAEAVPRRPGQLTQEDKIKLLSQGLPPDSCHDEWAIIKLMLDTNWTRSVNQVRTVTVTRSSHRG